MTDPLITVITPTNRISPYFSETLASLRAQSWDRWELVVVDDGCPDPDRLENAVSNVERVRVVHRPPRGLPFARNIGLFHAQGELVSFLDDDDVWHPDRLSRLATAHLGSPGSIGSFSSGWILDDMGETISTDWQDTAATREQLLGGAIDIPHIGTLLVQREAAVTLGGFNPSMRYNEDTDFTMRVLQWGEMVGIPDKLFGYRRHRDSFTANANIKAANRQIRLGLLMQISGAEIRGQGDVAQLLRANYSAFEARKVRKDVQDSLSHLKRGRLRPAASSFLMAIGQSPRATVGLLASTIRSAPAVRAGRSTR